MSKEKLQIILVAAMNLSMLGMASAYCQSSITERHGIQVRIEQTRCKMDTAIDDPDGHHRNSDPGRRPTAPATTSAVVIRADREDGGPNG